VHGTGHDGLIIGGAVGMATKTKVAKTVAKVAKKSVKKAKKLLKKAHKLDMPSGPFST
jgi:acetyl-CoA carboxylase alpha subunit